MTTKQLVKYIGMGFTFLGLVLAVSGDLSCGLLSMILGELIDMPKKI